MALRQRNCIKRITASGGGTLTAVAGESLLVRGIFCNPSSNDTYVTLRTDKVTVGYFRVKGKSGNHIPYPVTSGGDATALRSKSLLDWLLAAGYAMNFPVAEGQVLTVSRYAETGDVTLLFDRYDAADIKPTDLNGSQADVYRFIQYGTNSAAITAAGDVLLDTVVSPAEFPAFPINGVEVPAKRNVSILAIAGCPSARGNASANKGYTTYLKLLREREVLFDEDRNGLPFTGVVGTTADAETYDMLVSMVGPATVEEQAAPLIFVPGLKFTEGEELLPYVTVAAGASGGIAAAGLDVAFVLEVERVK